MKRLVMKLAVAAVGCLAVVVLVGCDVTETFQKSGVSSYLMKDRFRAPDAPMPPDVVIDGCLPLSGGSPSLLGLP